jgi:iron complex outermembrane receptor protein
MKKADTQPAQASRITRGMRPTPVAAAVRFALSAAIATGAGFASTAALAQASAPAPAGAAVLETITVQSSADASADGLARDYAGNQVARGARTGILGTTDMMSTPFSSTAYTAQLIQDQQARSVSDVLQNDPTVRTARGFGNFQELYVVRGFPVYSDDMAYNGLYGLLPRQYVATEFLERVEVLRGANTFLNGAAPGGSGIGGAINLLPKRAPNDPLTQFTVGVENGGQKYIATDLARRFGPENRAGIRINAARRDGETAIDREDRTLDVLSVGADYRGSNFRVSADVGYQNHRIDQPRPSVTPSGGIPAAPDASRNFAQPWTYSNERQRFGTVRGEVDLNNAMTAWFAAGMRNGDESNVLANPTATASGATTAYRFDNVRDDDVKTGEVGLRGKLRTGDIGHTWVVSASDFRSKSRNAYAFSDFAGFAGNLYAPFGVAQPAATFFTGGTLGSPLITDRTRTSSFAIADTMAFLGDRLLLTVGARHQTIDQQSYDYTTGAQISTYDKSKVSPMAGVVFKASKEISVYGNYIEGLVKGDVAPATSGGLSVINAGTALSPYRAQQTEVGVKYDAGKVGGSVALFSTDKPFGAVTNGVFGAGGEQRNRGLEISVFGQPMRGVRLLGGATFLDAKQRRTGSAALDGKDAIGVPDTQVNLGAEWDVPGVRGLALSGRAIYTASQPADAANTLELPSWTRLDLGARYLTTISGKAVTFRARVDNATDRNYWASAGGYPGANYLVLGAPRTFSLSASIDF